MTEYLTTNEGALAYDVAGRGPLVVLAHGMGDSRHAYRFVVPALVAGGFRVANVDIRGCGEASTGWPRYGRTDIAGDLVGLVRHLGGPAVLVGHSISGGATTIAAATAPDTVTGVVEVAPFTRKQSIDPRGLLRVKEHRRATIQLAKVMMGGGVNSWLRYLDLAVPAKPADWAPERARIAAALSRPGRMAVLRTMARSAPVDAGAQLPHVRRPVLVVQGSADPDWPDPGAEGDRILADLPTGLGELAVIDGAGHYPHTETPEAFLALLLPFLAEHGRAT